MTEKELHSQICSHLRNNHEEIIFTTDMSGIRLTMGQAVAAKKLRSDNGIPDILIFEPTNTFSGLLIEVKKETPYKKNGDLKSSPKNHLEMQSQLHARLTEKGYFTMFIWELDQFITVLNEYLKT